MPKHNQFIKKLQSRFLAVNNTLENFFNGLRSLKSNIKKIKFTNNSKAILFFGISVILVLSYFLIPTFYNKNEVKNIIQNQIFKNYNIEIKINEKIDYSLLPKPHFVAKNVLILRDEREIGLVENLKVFIAANKFFSKNNFKVKDLVFQKTDLNFYIDDLIFFQDLLKTEPSDNKIIFKNSNLFFKNSYDEILFINKIKKSEFYYDSINLVNVLSSENEVFNLPYKFVIKNDKFNKLVESKFNSKKVRLNVENILYYDEEIKDGLLDILFINKTTSLKYELKKNSLNFINQNQKNLYDGFIEFIPFYLQANFNYEGLSTKYLFNDESILIELIKSELLNNQNLNINIKLNVKDIININELNNFYLNLEIESGDIKISDAYVMWKDDLIINLNESLINYDQGEIFLTGRINVEIKDTNDFYSSFQINKKFRKEIKQIQFDFNYNFMQENISFDNLIIDKKKNNNIEEFIDDFNLNTKVLNKVTLKNFINEFFKIYFG